MVTFEDVAIYFSPQEWVELTTWQRELYQEGMMDNYDLVVSLGKDDQTPTEAGSCPTSSLGWVGVSHFGQMVLGALQG
uniref:KRAB domain-containing protein n=1 Tax=Athene cunicularia TaxID=194338 RepID=A0A663M467_ATHCN